MGKVRTSMIKRTARKLLSMYPDLFNEDFEHNKQMVKQLISVDSKKVRNQVAGYITHLVKIRKRMEVQQGG